jgi:aspartyl protease/uncharacterized protein DUF4124
VAASRAAVLLGLATALGLAPGPALAQLYRWTDASGTVHYTTDAGSIPPAYREEARDIGAPTPLPADPPPPPAGLILPYSGGPLVVDASLNGTPLRLLLDTGADRTLISPAAMVRAGLPVDGGAAVRIQGVTGDVVAPLVSIPRLDLAGRRLGPLAVLVHGLPAQDVDGLLGRDVLDAFTLTVDSTSRRAILTPR